MSNSWQSAWPSTRGRAQEACWATHGLAGCITTCLALICLYMAIDLYGQPAVTVTGRVASAVHISSDTGDLQSHEAGTSRPHADDRQRKWQVISDNGMLQSLRTRLTGSTVGVPAESDFQRQASDEPAKRTCSGIWGDPGCPGDGKDMSRDEMNTILTGEAGLSGQVEKLGMLPPRKWLPSKGTDQMRNGLNEWIWQHAIGTSDGELHALPRGVVPPKAAICTLLFNPVYKLILIKNTKVAGTSVFLNLGGFCQPGITMEKAKAQPPCLWHVTDVMRIGVQSLGYASWEALWADYTVMALVRNPYDRAGSSYDYTLGLRKAREGHCRDPKFEHFAARPYILGIQDILFGCGDAVHDFYHVEPQYTCLLDDADRLVADHIVRVNSLEADFALTLGDINARRPEAVPALESSIGWEQQGPVAKAVDGTPSSTTDSRHLDKFLACGPRCLGLIHDYYRKDFQLLQYPIGNISAPTGNAPEHS
eukprot:jgi/Ulvmu1/9575/UM054_0005.1